MTAKSRLGRWQNPTSRKCWIIAGERPSLTGAKRQKIQDLLQKRVLVTGDIATKLKTLSGFYVTGYIPRSVRATSIAESRFPLANNAPFFGMQCTPSSAARLQALADSFERGIGVIKEHALNYFHTMMLKKFEHVAEHGYLFAGDETRDEHGGASKSVLQEVHTREILALGVTSDPLACSSNCRPWTCFLPSLLPPFWLCHLVSVADGLIHQQIVGLRLS